MKMCLKDLLSEGSSEMCFELGEYFYEKEDFSEAAMWYYNAWHETECILNLQTVERARQRYGECAGRDRNEGKDGR